MLQRTLITNNAEELSAYIEEIGGMPEYKNEGGKLLLFSSPGADGDTLKARVAMIRRALPEVKIVGMSTHKSESEEENGFSRDGEDYSFLLMEQSHAEILYYDCRKLSAEEAETYFSSDAARQPGWWWLRSPNVNVDFNAGAVSGGGDLDINFVSNDYEFGARPAFQLNLASVLFTSAAVGGKSSGTTGAGALTCPDDYTVSEWKLTVNDTSRSGFAQ